MRIEQSERDFVEACGLDARSDGERVALGVRRAIANLGGVDQKLIRANDTFNDDLVDLEFWGSLDSIELVLEVEKCLGFAISDTQAQSIPDPESIAGYTVADFVRSVVEVCCRK